MLASAFSRRKGSLAAAAEPAGIAQIGDVPGLYTNAIFDEAVR